MRKKAAAEGRVLHERADAGGHETRGAVRTLRAVKVSSGRLGLQGSIPAECRILR